MLSISDIQAVVPRYWCSTGPVLSTPCLVIGLETRWADASSVIPGFGSTRGGFGTRPQVTGRQAAVVVGAPGDRVVDETGVVGGTACCTVKADWLTHLEVFQTPPGRLNDVNCNES